MPTVATCNDYVFSAAILTHMKVMLASNDWLCPSSMWTPRSCLWKKYTNQAAGWSGIGICFWCFGLFFSDEEPSKEWMSCRPLSGKVRCSCFGKCQSKAGHWELVMCADDIQFSQFSQFSQRPDSFNLFLLVAPTAGSGVPQDCFAATDFSLSVVTCFLHSGDAFTWEFPIFHERDMTRRFFFFSDSKKSVALK